MKPLRFAILGCGFWSRFQLAGWREVEGVECVALYNRTRSKAEALAGKFGIPEAAVYDYAERLLNEQRLDFADIITDVDTHGRFVRLAASRGLPAAAVRLGRSAIRPRPRQHRPVQRRYCGRPARGEAGRDHRRGQPADRPAGLRGV